VVVSLSLLDLVVPWYAYSYARLFKLDNPIAHFGCGPGMYSGDAVGSYKLDVDVFAIPAAFLHGLLG
jgi:hypothetical protein